MLKYKLTFILASYIYIRVEIIQLRDRSLKLKEIIFLNSIMYLNSSFNVFLNIIINIVLYYRSFFSKQSEQGPRRFYYI